ncbi:MAG TPA: protein translocase subunit SecD [Candidatus Acidoferrales bacterium]|jgi:SecD/SecF fusion protein|nr:protein translocase subunit SecD [Candidatus Acidoferrales bacterium]
MKQNNLNWFIVVICVVCWSLYEVYPPTSRDLVAEFASRGLNQDAAFKQIVAQATDMQKADTNSTFAVLQEAIGTNDLQKYFPGINASNQVRPNLYILNRLQRDAAGKIKLGLDLQGGTSYRVEMDTTVLNGTNKATEAEVSGALSQAVEVLRKRIDKFGVAEPVIQPAGNNDILIQLPGLSPADKAAAMTNIQRSAFLEFRMVHDRSAEIVDSRSGQLLGAVPPGYEVLRHVSQNPGGGQQMEAYVVKKRPASGNAADYLAGDIVKDAKPYYDNMGAMEISFELTADAGRKFADITTANVGHQMAIVLDGELYSAPTIQVAILTGSGTITGHYTQEEVRTLVNVLQNPLKAPLHIVSSQDVGPTLGKDNIKSGINASMYGVIFVSLFMFCYYFVAGIAANIALVTNVIILLGVMCAAGTTFTLPGIAGGVLTVGMAVDANVLIYERIREELAKGKSLRGAIDAGYARAFGTIFDSHVTTLISSIILIWMGTGEIKGFGVTLTIGVAASLFTALVVTRLIFNFLTERNIIKSLPMMHIIRSSKVGFMSVAKPLAIATTMFAIGAILYGGVVQGKRLFGVDFLGGDNNTFSFVQKPGIDEIRSVLTTIGEKDATVQYQKEMGGTNETLSVTTASGSSEKVKATLASQLPQAQFKPVSGFTVGASVGKEIQYSAAVAALCAMFGILFYVAARYEFSFAVAAIIAVLHDVLLTIGVFCIANAASGGGRQFSATVVAALLTIIGFSINDKIVIFDRIREDLKLGMRGSFKEIINHALNQTLSRTIITSGTVFIATAVLFFCGGGAINDFAFTFLVGIVTGTYSSIFVATVIILMITKGERPNLGASQVSVQNSASAKV